VVRLDDALGAEPKLLFADECHFADEGAARVAAALAARLEEGVSAFRGGSRSGR
jgi:lysophospholipase L1-like esterase